MPKKCVAHGRQMPWLTFGVPDLMTPLHHAQTSVGSRRVPLTDVFILLAELD